MSSRTAGRRAAALERVRAVASAAGLPGVVLTRPGSVAWASGAINPPIDRTAATDTVWLAVGPSDYTVITTKVERPRLIAELVPVDVDVIEVDWFDGPGMLAAAAAALGSDPAALGSDVGDFGVDVSDELVRIRLALSPAEQEDLTELAHDATFAVESALRVWQPGEPDFAIASRISAAIEAVGGDAPCLLVGGDERLANFRHPVPNGARPERIVMAVLVARRGGLHVALTRYVATLVSDEYARGLETTQRLHVALLDAVQPGATYGDLLRVLDAEYAAAGFADEWKQHYQGGPIGFGQREFEIAPSQTDSIWWNEPIRPGVALAYNPSLPGGFKDEDTYLVDSDYSLRWLTASADWPIVTVAGRPRPAVLVLHGRDS